MSHKDKEGSAGPPSPASAMDMDADALLEKLQGSAAEVMHATGLKVESMQTAITWLITQTKQQAAHLRDVEEEREQLRAQVATLEATLENKVQGLAEQQQQSAGVDSVRAEMNAFIEKTAKDFEGAAAATASVAASTDATWKELQVVARRADDLAEGAATAKKELSEKLGSGVAGQAQALEASLASRISNVDAKHDAAFSALTERLGPTEELARASATRLSDLEGGLDARLAELSEGISRALDEKVTALGSRLEAAEGKIESARESLQMLLEAQAAPRAAPQQTALAVGPTSTAAEAIDQGESKASYSGRLAHIEWLLDAIQGDSSAMHEEIQKIKATSVDHTEQLGDLRSANAAAFAEGSRASSPTSRQGSPPFGSARQLATFSEVAPAPWSTNPEAPAEAPAPRSRRPSTSKQEAEAFAAKLETRLSGVEAQLAKASGARGDKPSASVLEAIEAQIAPLKRLLKTKAEQSELVRVEKLAKKLVQTAGIGGGGGGEVEGGSSSVAQTLAALAAETQRIEALRDQLDELSAHHEQLAVKVESNERLASEESSSIQDAIKKFAEAFEAAGVDRAATSAVRRAMAPPLELLALCVCRLAEGDRWGTTTALAHKAANEANQPQSVIQSLIVNGSDAELMPSRLEAALAAFRPHRAAAAASGGAALGRLAELLVAGELHPKMDEAIGEGSPMYARGGSISEHGGATVHSPGSRQPTRPASAAAQCRRATPLSMASVTSPAAGKVMSRPRSAAALTKPGPGCAGQAGMSGSWSHASLVLGESQLENRIRELERSLAQGSSLELRLTTLERHARGASSHSQKDAWGKLWNANNLLQYRIQAIEHALAGRQGSPGRGGLKPAYAEKYAEFAQAIPGAGALMAPSAPPHRMPNQHPQGGGGAGGAEPPPTKAPPSTPMPPDDNNSSRNSTRPGSGSRVRPGSGGRARPSSGGRTRHGDALLALIPGMIGDDADDSFSSISPSPIPSQHSTRPSSAKTHRQAGGQAGGVPPSPGGSLRPLSADGDGAPTPTRTASITPLDGVGGPAGTGGDFHLGVVHGSCGAPAAASQHGGIGAVSWQ